MRSIRLLAAVAAAALAAASCGSTPPLRADVAEAAPPAADDTARFERMKALPGDWVSRGAEGCAPPGATVSYRVTSGGSALLETIFAGSPHEMVTLYHLDRGRLVLTHYCAMRNQPHMEALPGGPHEPIAFRCVSLGSGAESDGHMHEAAFEFVDADHLRTAWTFHEGGRPTEVARFELERVHLLQ